MPTEPGPVHPGHARSRTVHRYVNLAIAVDLDEQGLVAPVVRDADLMNLRGLALAIRQVATKATSRRPVAVRDAIAIHHRTLR